EIASATESRPARIELEDAGRDLALLRLAPGQGGAPVAVGRLAPEDAGAELVVLSRRPGAGGDDPRLIPARLAGWTPRALPGGGFLRQLRLEAETEPGDSGAPVLRVSDGALVGVLTSRAAPEARPPVPTSFATPLEEVPALVARF